MAAQRADVLGLMRAAWRDAPLLGANVVAMLPARAARCGGVTQRRVDGRVVDRVTLLQTAIEIVEHVARHLGIAVGAGNHQPVAARHQGDAELALDALQVAVALAEQFRQQRIVVELHLHGDGGLARWVHRATSPARL